LKKIIGSAGDMKKTIVKFLVIFSAVILLAACGNQPTDYPDVMELRCAEFDAATIYDLFLAVLMNERMFSHQSGMVYFDDFRYEYNWNGTEFFREVFDFTILDMNGDGVPEIIVGMSHTQVINLVLRYYDGEIYGHDFVFRSMGNIKTDGTFSNSFGGSSGIARLNFIGGSYEYEFIYRIALRWCNYSEGTVVLLNDVEIPDEEFREWLDDRDAKESATWHSFDAQTIAADFAVAWGNYFRESIYGLSLD